MKSVAIVFLRYLVFLYINHHNILLFKPKRRVWTLTVGVIFSMMFRLYLVRNRSFNTFSTIFTYGILIFLSAVAEG